jgi:glucosamine--fructose-6-phosphate aminotransferase (isomerizing)
MSESQPAPRSGHPYHMHDAIYAQPGALRLVARGQGDALEAAAMRLRGLDRVLLTGVGTSYHAALVGELLLARLGGLGLKARAFHAFELASYWPDSLAQVGAVMLSHGGTRRFAREALARVKASGGTAVVISGKGPEAPAEADWTLRTVDQEISGAHTVSYTAALAILAKLAAAAGGQAEVGRSIDGIPDMLAFLLGQESWDDLAARYGDRRCYWFVGGGPNAATAWEAALKMNEASHAPAVGFNCEQFLHGAWAALEREDVVVVIAPPGPSHERCIAAARVAKEVGAPVVALAREDDRELGALAAETIALPEIDELLSPILTIVPLQLFIYHTAVHRGVNPDLTRADDPAYGRARSALSL